MTYLAILTVILAGAYASFSYFLPTLAENTTTGEGSGLLGPLQAAKKAALQLEGKATTADTTTPLNDPAIMPTTTAKMLVAGGCFWCVEADLEKLPGVLTVVSGYAGGRSHDPTYSTYAADGHKEVVEVSYNPALVSFEEILIYALKHLDPTDGAGSFGDRGASYAPAFYYRNETEKSIINNLITEVNTHGPYEKALAIAVEPMPVFYEAEAYHQDYYKGTLSSLKYRYYRNASGRDAFIEKYWGTDTQSTLSWRKQENENISINKKNSMTTPHWSSYQKPTADSLKSQMDPLAFKVTQAEGTERAGTSPLDKNYERGIYVDILSGEPLFSSRDKFDSGTGWPSFVKPISEDVVTEHQDNTFFSKRTEVRSKIADNHLGHVFPDGPSDRGGLRYCLNGVALTFIPEAEMVLKGYGDYINSLSE